MHLSQEIHKNIRKYKATIHMKHLQTPNSLILEAIDKFYQEISKTHFKRGLMTMWRTQIIR